MTRLRPVSLLPARHYALLVILLTERSAPLRSPSNAAICSRTLRAGTLAPHPSLTLVMLRFRLLAARFPARVTLGRAPQTR